MIKKKQSIKNRDQLAVETTEAFNSIATQKANINSQDDSQIMQMNDSNEKVEKVLRVQISRNATRDEVNVTSMTKKEEKRRMMKELKIIKMKKERTLLRQKLEQARAKQIADFRIVITSIAFRVTDVLQKKKLFKTIDFKKYKKINQHDLNIFIRECDVEYEFKFIIYANDKNKIFFAHEFLNDASTNH
jgi:hypothetical protein